MDNASKALIMAGAILIAVMLISLGVLLYNRAADVANNSTNQLNAIEVNAHNNTYSMYFGEYKTYTDVKALCDKVNTQPVTDINQYGLIKITGTVSGGDRSATTVGTKKPNALQSGKSSYKISLSKSYANGAIQEITVANM